MSIATMHSWFMFLGLIYVYASCRANVDGEGDIQATAVLSENSLVDESDSFLTSAVDDAIQTNPSSSENEIEDGAPVASSKLDENVTVDEEIGASGHATPENVSISSAVHIEKRVRPTKVECLRMNTTVDDIQGDGHELAVQLFNQTSHVDLFKTTPNTTVAPCSLMLFYAPYCPFSAGAAPHFSAMARLYPDIPCIAVDASTHVSLNARYGTVALPTLYLFHNGHPVAKFNESTYVLDRFVAFVRKYASIEPLGSVNVTSADFAGPLPSEPTQDTDWLLWLAWFFVVCCSAYGVTKSSLWDRMLESLRNNWHEAEAQHEHAE